jgi:hypothetical protein
MAELTLIRGVAALWDISGFHCSANHRVSIRVGACSAQAITPRADQNKPGAGESATADPQGFDEGVRRRAASSGKDLEHTPS